MTEYKKLSSDSRKKIIDSKEILKRQDRVVDVFRVLDDLELDELSQVSLLEEAEHLPMDSEERVLIEGKVETLANAERGFSPSGSGVGGAIGAGLGGLIGLLIARSAKDENVVAWAGLGAAVGGAVGALIGSFWN